MCVNIKYYLSKLSQLLVYEAIQKIDVVTVTIHWCFKDQRQILKSAIVHNSTETVRSNSAATNARMMVSMRSNIICSIHSRTITNQKQLYPLQYQ